MHDLIMTIPRCVISIFWLFLVTKIIGKRQISNLSLFDYVIGISIGNFIAEMVLNIESNYFIGILAMLIFGITSFIVDRITLLNIPFRRFIEGCPEVIINDGKILKKALKKANMNINDLEGSARLKDIFNLKEIRYAILEPNGELSFIKYKDNIDLSKNIIIDGKLLKETIKELNICEEEINNYLKENKTKKEETLLLTYQNGNFILYKE